MPAPLPGPWLRWSLLVGGLALALLWSHLSESDDELLRAQAACEALEAGVQTALFPPVGAAATGMDGVILQQAAQAASHDLCYVATAALGAKRRVIGVDLQEGVVITGERVSLPYNSVRAAFFEEAAARASEPRCRHALRSRALDEAAARARCEAIAALLLGLAQPAAPLGAGERPRPLPPIPIASLPGRLEALSMTLAPFSSGEE